MEEMWWLIGEDVAAHWSRCGGSCMVKMWWLIGEDVVAHSEDVVAHW